MQRDDMDQSGDREGRRGDGSTSSIFVGASCGRTAVLVGDRWR